MRDESLQRGADHMAAILAGVGVGQHLAGHRSEAARAIEFRQAGNAASGVAAEPRNCSISRRSKSILRTTSLD